MKRKVLRSLVVVFVGINMFLSINIAASNRTALNLEMLEARANSDDDSEIFDPDPDDDIIPTSANPEDGFWTGMIKSIFE
ncbi:hypothetical protein EYV94_11075 [Puteibacter caeruleilacunae]|nr:hypothetical protein EYV94_11075 [Puteibacter caeruleilacunae]